MGFGARPAAVAADAHDRLMASVSHLPHVLANVLVAQAAARPSSARAATPAVGPSLRDATRVAGANTAIWTDIYLANREALIEAIDEAVRRLEDVRAALRRATRRRSPSGTSVLRAERETLLGPDS